MTKLMNKSLRTLMIYATVVLICSIPAYYFTMSRLWQYELDEHNVILTPEAGREDSFLIIGVVTLLTVLFFAALLSGFILVNRRLSSKIWQPFYRSLGKIKHFELGQLEKIEFESTEIEEFAELNQSLDKLIAGNTAAYNQQKEFADNASHELQTPLAIIQSRLDLLLQSKSLTTEQFDIIEDANRALSRVARINKNLLLLTKIGNHQFLEIEPVRLMELMEQILASSAQFFEEKNLFVQTELTPNVTLEGNKILVEILLTNLITNAIRHTIAGGKVHIQLLQHKLVISNNGEKPLNKEQLFKRFATTSSQSPGTGLGLALVKQIADRYHWEITYSFNTNQHTFSLHF